MTSPALAPDKPCPICGKPALENYRPFCSKRCADVDLNRWLSGVYAVPAEEDDESEKVSREAHDSESRDGEPHDGEGR